MNLSLTSWCAGKYSQSYYIFLMIYPLLLCFLSCKSNPCTKLSISLEEDQESHRKGIERGIGIQKLKFLVFYFQSLYTALMIPITLS